MTKRNRKQEWAERRLCELLASDLGIELGRGEFPPPWVGDVRHETRLARPAWWSTACSKARTSAGAMPVVWYRSARPSTGDDRDGWRAIVPTALLPNAPRDQYFTGAVAGGDVGYRAAVDAMRSRMAARA